MSSLRARSRTPCFRPSIHFVTLLALLSALSLVVVAGPPPTANPYSVLGVSADATDEEIKRNYRKLCLQYHPDKNVGKPKQVQEANEDKFKQVQQAYDEIETAEKRRNYELRRRDAFSFASSASRRRASSTGSSAAAESYLRSLRREFGAFPGTTERRFYNVRPETRFYPRGVNVFFSRNSLFGVGNRWIFGVVKSVFVEKVWLDLETLYTGNKEVELRCQDSWWRRLRAAFRGGLWLPVMLQSLVTMASLSRVIGARLSFLVSMVTFWTALPSLTEFEAEQTYTLPPGHKGGTKLTYANAAPGVDVVFVLKERPHGRFTRVGNDLLTTVEIYESEAKSGCAKTLDPLDKNESPIVIELQANQIGKSGQQVTVKGRGWPVRKRGGRKGDLIVTVQVLPDKKQHRGRRKPQN